MFNFAVFVLLFAIQLLNGDVFGGDMDAMRYDPGITSSVNDVCPGLLYGTPETDNDFTVPSLQEYKSALQTLDINRVFQDLYKLLVDSQDCWPADEFNGERNYGGLMIRLAWHCAGTFRITDGRGGCAGGRQRYSPEASWGDNTNLDKARALLAPIKIKYGDALSWGDLFVFAGTAAIKLMGGPVSQVCGGRIDDPNGRLSDPLNEPCDNPGNCGEPTGASTVGLIYVNPEGVNGVPDPIPSAARIREIFGRMGMDDSGTVALIGGGHAFGKSHGACRDGAGEPPNENPFNPWNGNCGTGRGPDTFTSGIEGQWTTFPFRWDNEYYQQLINDEYELEDGPGGAKQWRNKRNGLMMMTTDLALVNDDAFYEIVENYANNLDALDEGFSKAWETLVTNGNGWVEEQYRVCVSGNDIAPRARRPNSRDSPDSPDTPINPDEEKCRGPCGLGTSGPCIHANLNDFTCYPFNFGRTCFQGTIDCSVFACNNDCAPGTSGPCISINAGDNTCYNKVNGICPQNTIDCPRRGSNAAHNNGKNIEVENEIKTIDHNINLIFTVMSILGGVLILVVGIMCIINIKSQMKNKEYSKLPISTQTEAEATCV